VGLAVHSALPPKAKVLRTVQARFQSRRGYYRDYVVS
jgi:hypothetical protein